MIKTLQTILINMKLSISMLVFLCASFNLSSQNKQNNPFFKLIKASQNYQNNPFFQDIKAPQSNQNKSFFELIEEPQSNQKNPFFELIEALQKNSNKFQNNPFLKQIKTCKNSNIVSNVDYLTLQNHKNFHLLPSRCTCGLQEEFLDTRVSNNETAIKEFPWMVLLEYSNGKKSIGYLCGGSLINIRYVLTAAHCVKTKTNTKLIRVRLGEHDFTKIDNDCDHTACNDPPHDVKIEKIVYSKDYDSRNFTHDIALLRLDRRIKMTPFIKPICLPLNDERIKAGSPLFIAGWGRRDESGQISNVKIKAQVASISDRDCRKYWQEHSFVVLPSQFCAGGHSSTNTCKGDSGGPIMSTFHYTKQWYAEGIVSYGSSKCGGPPVPTVYTRVSYYIKWILDNIEE